MYRAVPDNWVPGSALGNRELSNLTTFVYTARELATLHAGRSGAHEGREYRRRPPVSTISAGGSAGASWNAVPSVPRSSRSPGRRRRSRPSRCFRSEADHFAKPSRPGTHVRFFAPGSGRHGKEPGWHLPRLSLDPLLRHLTVSLADNRSIADLTRQRALSY